MLSAISAICLVAFIIHGCTKFRRSETAHATLATTAEWQKRARRTTTSTKSSRVSASASEFFFPFPSSEMPASISFNLI